MIRMPTTSLPYLMAARNEGDIEKNSGKKDEGAWVDLGTLGGCCSKHGGILWWSPSVQTCVKMPK